MLQHFAQYRRDRPDWWLMAIAGAAWVVVVVESAFSIGESHSSHSFGAGFQSTIEIGAWIIGGLPGWCLMVAAMMLPLAARDARWLANRSLRSRRTRTVLLCAGGFMAVWLAAGIVVLVILRLTLTGSPAAGVALLVAGAWQIAPARRGAFARCGSALAPAITGRAADLDCLRAGGRTGRRCVLTCGLMMVPMAAIHSTVVMLAVSAINARERRRAPNPEARVGSALDAMGLIALSLVVTTSGLLGLA